MLVTSLDKIKNSLLYQALQKQLGNVKPIVLEAFANIHELLSALEFSRDEEEKLIKLHWCLFESIRVNWKGDDGTSNLCRIFRC